ncbi:patatin-like phospholipase family protein [Propionibacteriaceae bacterium G57]|uniref:patatin-like phospholipase family protein n=1 Tax=Aestuariimicrobium sp. G57 TaxID=3418485 RepID=UPI003DA7A378
MARLWTGLPKLAWGNTAPKDERRQGLVLSGGGARASFQIGALRYLYDRAGIHPTTMVGTSAGSILTAMLSQYLDRDEQVAALGRIEDLWLSMTRQDQMFAPRPWFQRLQERGAEWGAALDRGVRPTSPDVPEPITDDEVAEAEELTGQARTLQLATTEPTLTKSSLTAAQVLPLMSLLPRLRTAGGDISMILRGADASRSMFYPGAILLRLLDEEFFSSARVATSGVVVRISMVGLESGELRYMTEKGELVDRTNQPVAAAPVVDLSLGALASCSIPAVFPPVQIGDDWYVDGGTREATPAEMAMGPLEVDDCYVVVSAPVQHPPVGSFASKSMLSIVLRSVEILTDEAERDEVALARGGGAMVIEPDLFVHDATTVDCGLTRINRDYGWLRAAEAHLGLGRREETQHRQLIELRLKARLLEERVLATPDDEELLLDLARLKFTIRDHLSLLDSSRLPDDAQTWWRDWESHDPRPELKPTWLSH